MARVLLPLLLVAVVVLVVMVVASGVSALAGRRTERLAARRGDLQRSALRRERAETLVLTARARRTMATTLLADPLVDQVEHAAVADLLVALDALPALGAEDLLGPDGALRTVELEAALAALDAATAVVARRVGHLRSFGGEPGA